MSDDTNEAPVKQAKAQPAAKSKRPRPDDKLVARRAERKKRGVVDHGYDKRLALDESKLDTQNYVYRQVIDRPGRVARLENREYELVTDDQIGGQDAARHGGVDREGGALQYRLMRKWKAWYEEDRAERLKSAREQDAALMQGKAAILNEEGGGADYASEGNTISAAEVG
jgi:hypothetical protein